MIGKGEESHHQPPGHLSWLGALACSLLSREKACQEKDACSFQADATSSEGTQLSEWNPG